MHKIIFGRDQFLSIAESLDSLLPKVGVPVTMQWPLLNLWIINNPQIEPLAVLVQQNEGLVAAGFFSCFKKNGFLLIKKIGVQGEPYSLLAQDQEAFEALAQILPIAFNSLNYPWILHLSDLEISNSPTLPLSKFFLENKELNPSFSPKIFFNRDEGLNSYISKNTRSALAKAKNRIINNNLAMRGQWLKDIEEIENCIDQIIEVHRDRNRRKRGRAILDDLKERQLFRETVITYAKLNKARVYVLYLDDSLAAFSIGIIDNNMLWVYANLVSPNWLNYSAGLIANAEVVKMAYYDRSLDGVNWGQGLQRYKLSGNASLIPSGQLMAWSSFWCRLTWKIYRVAKYINLINRNQSQTPLMEESENETLDFS